MPLPIVDDEDAEEEVHVAKAARSKGHDNAQRRVLTDSLKVNRGLAEDKRGSATSSVYNEPVSHHSTRQPSLSLVSHPQLNL